MAWKPGIFLNFCAQNPMYAGCNGATFVYAICLIVTHIYVQNIEFFTLE
jgi:hypothetical protein